MGLKLEKGQEFFFFPNFLKQTITRPCLVFFLYNSSFSCVFGIAALFIVLKEHL